MNQEYLIWSIEHGAWWGPQWRGYTQDLSAAGIYSRIEAEAILRQANLVRTNECMIPVACVTRDTTGP